LVRATSKSTLRRQGYKIGKRFLQTILSRPELQLTNAGRIDEQAPDGMTTSSRRVVV
jgi:hypothetical protein